MIPKILHRIWLDEPVPPQYDAWWERFRLLHPDWELMSWQDRSELDWLQNQELFDSFDDSRPSYGFRADILRYELLNRFGGVYVDTDVEPLRAFDPLVEADERPFIAWCSEAELDPAIIASPPGHPAVRALVDDLASVHQWKRSGRPLSPPGSTGPRFVTQRWQARDDVRRLPPVTFFPYHWKNMEEGLGPWSERTYAVHHWAGGWKLPARFMNVPARDELGPRLSVLIPFRDDGTRSETLEWIKKRWATVLPNAEIIVGTDEGTPFSKTAAVNDAYSRATGDVFIVSDADSWADVSVMRPAIASAAASGRLVVPWSIALRTGEEDSAAILKMDPAGHIDTGTHLRGKALPPPTANTAGILFVIRRDAFEFVCGMDERFRGYGFEDVAFRRACDALLPSTIYQRGQVISLSHARPRNMRARTWGEDDNGRMNTELGGRYAKAERSRAAMRDLCNEHPLPHQVDALPGLSCHTLPATMQQPREQRQRTGQRIGSLRQQSTRIRERL